LQLFYGQPYQRRELTYKMIKELSQKLVLDKPNLAPMQVWRASTTLSGLKRSLSEAEKTSPLNELIALVSLVRNVCGIDEMLTPYDKTVDKNFQDWVWKRHSGAGHKFTEEQMEWLRMIKEHVTSSFHIEKDDFDYNPFNSQGGLARMWQLFGDETEKIINELNEVLAA